MPTSERPQRGRRKAEQPHAVDIHVGSRIRARRAELGISQEKLAGALGVTFQQVQKYERGTNRTSASRLYYLSRVLEVEVPYFFEELEGPARAGGFSETSAEPFESDPMARPDTAPLIEAFYAIRDPIQRRRLLELARSLAIRKPSS